MKSSAYGIGACKTVMKDKRATRTIRNLIVHPRTWGMNHFSQGNDKIPPFGKTYVCDYFFQRENLSKGNIVLCFILDEIVKCKPIEDLYFIVHLHKLLPIGPQACRDWRNKLHVCHLFLRRKLREQEAEESFFQYFLTIYF